MTSYCEEEYLQLSGIQHYEFCPRQWALIHIEDQWADNFLTASGNLIHENAHDPFFTEKRSNIIISRSMAIHSPELGISGECDVVEFTRASEGITLSGRDGLWNVCPVEYKRGEPKQDEHDRVQLAAQVMCLEYMFVCSIPKAYLYYNQTHRREQVEISEALRNRVKEDLVQMHAYTKAGYTPRVKKSIKCRACSLADVCLPKLSSCCSAREYICSHLSEGE